MQKPVTHKAPKSREYRNTREQRGEKIKVKQQPMLVFIVRVSTGKRGEEKKKFKENISGFVMCCDCEKSLKLF